jgi:hypothetical protein
MESYTYKGKLRGLVADLQAKIANGNINEFAAVDLLESRTLLSDAHDQTADHLRTMFPYDKPESLSHLFGKMNAEYSSPERPEFSVTRIRAALDRGQECGEYKGTANA